MKCKAKGCKNEATMISPANLCLAHWQWWFWFPGEDSDYALKEVLKNEIPKEHPNKNKKVGSEA